MSKIYAGIEAGGSWFRWVIGSDPQDILFQGQVSTTTPAETMGQVATSLQKRLEILHVESVGLASFGPLDINPLSADYGHILRTPKMSWTGVDILGFFQQALKMPVALNTDVNAAALAEYKWGGARESANFVYLTVGTGIGGAIMIRGKFPGFRLHPEMGHIFTAHNWQNDPYPGCCPFHGDCWEGLASGESLRLRWGKSAEFLPDDHAAWELESHYLAMGICNLVYVLSPKKIIIGGGVMKHSALFKSIREKVKVLANDYVPSSSGADGDDNFIGPPGLGDRAGLLGTLALASEIE